MHKVSKRTRNEFEDYLVSNSVLREITKFFENYDIPESEIPPEKQTTSSRRNLIRSYYASLNWDDPNDIIKILNVYSDILHNLGDENRWDYREDRDSQLLIGLTNYLKKDGFVYSEGKIEYAGNVSTINLIVSKSILDNTHFQEYIDRIKRSVETDPPLAIGSTKELVESTLKTILSELSIEYGKTSDIPTLLRLVQKALKLVPDDVDEKIKGADHIKVLLSNLGQIVVKIAELRNLYGTGHGREGGKSALKSRHARLVANAGIALSTFLIENYKEQNAAKSP